jgi:hypothetical protein
MELKATSVVVTSDRAKSFSWITVPALPDTLRRLQWRFSFSPQGSGTQVSHELEVEWGDLKGPMLQGLRDNYEQARAGIVRDGMDKTLQNLKKAAEKSG